MTLRGTNWPLALGTIAGLALAGFAGPTLADKPTPANKLPAASDEIFATKVAPILARHCADCHSGDEAEAALHVTSRERLLYGALSGPVVVPGQAGASLLIKLVHAEGAPHMPPEGQLSDDEIATLSSWIDQLPADAAPQRTLAGGEHWAYQPITRPTPPPVRDEGWVRNPIDRFVLAGLEAAGLTPAPEASAETLCRRLYFDLIGLPPAPHEVAEFVRAWRHDADAAYEALVDRLLASPHYGQRWARHWLDLARYADSAGFHDDLDRPHAWRYRDYVVNSFNLDKPYGQFVVEQLAGDELSPDEADAWIATGFCRHGPSNDRNMGAGLAKEKYRLDLLDDVISTTSAVFLGQSIGCARCHDHKYDPIAQVDYYRLLAVFDNTRRVEVPLNGDGRPLPDQATDVSSKNAPKQGIMALTDTADEIQTTYVLWRGDAANRGPVVEPGLPPALANTPLEIPPLSAERSTTGRRRALAEWIAAPDNPLTWRVVANRVWQHHLGVGLVATPSNLGRTGAAPSHPELLDWLAGQMLAQQGRFKPLHRLIVTSATYRQSTHYNARAAEVDPQNKLLWRMNQRRLEAEALRDAVLATAGTLNHEFGGPGVKPRIRPELLEASQRNKWPVVERDGPAQWRRSLYIYVKRQLPFPMLELFDAPATTHTCECRAASVVPTQALVMMNDEFTEDQAGYFADRVRAEAGTRLADQVARAVWLALSRAVLPDEREEAVAFVKQQTAQHRAVGVPFDEAARLALVDFCHVLLNSNEFAYLD